MPSFLDEDARVRRWLAWKITIIQRAAGKFFTNEYLIPVYRALLVDNDVNVKNAAKSRRVGFISLIDRETMIEMFDRLGLSGTHAESRVEPSKPIYILIAVRKRIIRG